MRKKISTVLCCFLAFSCLCGCDLLGSLNGKSKGNNTTDSASEGGEVPEISLGEVPEGIPTYEDLEEEFFISGYCHPANLTKEVWQRIPECGLNYVYIDPWGSKTNINNEQNIVKALELCEQVGIKGLIMPNNTHNIDGVEEPVSFSDYKVDYRQYEGFGGFYAFDEPNSTQFDWIAEDYAKFKAWDTESKYLYMVTMMQIDRSSTNAIANSDDFYSVYGEKLVKNFADHTRIVSMDSYPLTYSIKHGYNRIKEAYIGNVDRGAYTAKQHNAKFYNFIQTVGYGYGENRQPTRVEDIRWQIGTSLAFGAKGVQCFTFNSLSNPGYTSAVLTPAGQPTEIFEFCKQSFAELRAWEDVYLAFNYQGTMPVNTDAKSYNENDVEDVKHNRIESARIKEVKAERDLLIGVFKDGNGYDGFLFNSYNDPYYRKTNKINVEFQKASKAVVYLNGVRSEVDLNGGVFSYEMQASDILFVIPVV